jgi:hypothetical protein
MEENNLKSKCRIELIATSDYSHLITANPARKTGDHTSHLDIK